MLINIFRGFVFIIFSTGASQPAVDRGLGVRQWVVDLTPPYSVMLHVPI